MMFKTAIGRLMASLFFVAGLMLVFLLYTAPSYTVAPRSPQATLTPQAYLPFLHRDVTIPPPIIRIVQIYLPSILPKAYEYVKIENQGGSAQVMTGWKLKNENNSEVFTFPEFTLQPGKTVKVYSRAGDNDDDELYWWDKDPYPIWRKGHIGCLYEAGGARVHCRTAGR